MLLALDTATAAVTVAVHDGRAGGEVLVTRTVVDARAHTERLSPLVAEVLAEAGVAPDQLTRIAVGVGPGPFTGLRIGVVTARTLGAVLGIPVLGLCTHDVLAAEASAAGLSGELLVVTDARRREVYLARYRAEAGRAQRFAGPVVTTAAVVATDLPAVGAGALAHPEHFPGARGPEHPSAGWLARCVADGYVQVLAPDPLYLRRPDAREPGARKRVSQ